LLGDIQTIVRGPARVSSRHTHRRRDGRPVRHLDEYAGGHAAKQVLGDLRLVQVVGGHAADHDADARAPLFPRDPVRLVQREHDVEPRRHGRGRRRRAVGNEQVGHAQRLQRPALQPRESVIAILGRVVTPETCPVRKASSRV
jgi:hypothetical protein